MWLLIELVCRKVFWCHLQVSIFWSGPSVLNNEYIFPNHLLSQAWCFVTLMVSCVEEQKWNKELRLIHCTYKAELQVVAESNYVWNRWQQQLRSTAGDVFVNQLILWGQFVVSKQQPSTEPSLFARWKWPKSQYERFTKTSLYGSKAQPMCQKDTKTILDNIFTICKKKNFEKRETHHCLL